MLAEDIVIPSSVTTEASLEEQNDGSHSPRTKVTHRFQNLTIRHGSGAKDFDTLANELQRPLLAVEPVYRLKDDAKGDAMDEDMEFETGYRKRFKPLEPLTPHAPTTEDLSTMMPASVSRPKPGVSFSGDWTGTPTPTSSPGKQRSSPSKPDNRTASQPSPSPPTKADSKPASPPPSQQPATTSTSPSSEASTTSPPDFRASLTWQEEEITIYDPEDSDDDGTGINGIGFKPTAAVAYARGMKRKQQLAEYRKREEREARARRNMRRRGTPTPVPEGITGKDKLNRGKDRDTSRRKIATKERRVRFLEANVAGAEAVKASQ
jgi:hypothetical protein